MTSHPFVAGIREERGGHKVPHRVHDAAPHTARGTCGEESQQFWTKSATPAWLAWAHQQEVRESTWWLYNSEQPPLQSCIWNFQNLGDSIIRLRNNTFITQVSLFTCISYSFCSWWCMGCVSCQCQWVGLATWVGLSAFNPSSLNPNNSIELFTFAEFWREK